jgi:hypothetical protein
MLSFAYQKDLIETGEEKGFVSPGVPTEWVEGTNLHLLQCLETF